MKVFVSQKYMLFPVNTKVSAKRVLLYDGAELLFDFACKIDNFTPDFTAYMDVSAYFGREIELVIEPDVPYQPRFSDKMDLPMLWKEQLRPEAHFTVKNGWNNDPNGLIFADGVYHMFYQYNPAAPEWENMHWGHAVSTDLLHWEEKDIALFPDRLGTMFLESAMIDQENRAGFGKNAFLLYYTAAGGKGRMSLGQKFTQCLAYSADGGETFMKYSGNPIVPHREASNRDPKIVYVEKIGKYIMAIYRAEGRYELLSSTDLLHWAPFQDLALHDDAECPDLFALVCGGKKLWVFMGAKDIYLVGYFEKDRFVVENSEKKLTYFQMSYAAQSFSNVPDGRVVRIAWQNLKVSGTVFASQMGMPTEMRLEKTADRYYLCAEPIKEIETLYTDGGVLEKITLTEPVRVDVGIHAVDFSISAPYVQGEKLLLNIFGIEIAMDMESNEVRCKRAKMPLSLLGGRAEVRIIVDKCSAEIFADGGRFFIAVAAFSDYNLPYFVLQKNKNIKIDRLAWHTLENIHTRKG